MGQVLQIRVIAQTYNVADVEKRWPRLFALAFGANSPVPEDRRGVLAMAENLRQVVEFEVMGKALSEQLKPGIGQVVAAQERLENALADWKPAEAEKASVALEDALDALERMAPNG